MTKLQMRVERIDALTPTIRRLLLVSASGTPLPSFSAGAHVGLQVPLGERMQRRAYSLVNSTDHAHHYEIAVQLEPNSSGGSSWVHQLRVGAAVEVSAPRNDFPLDDSAHRYLLIAGGIGITPILSMARTLQKAGKSYALHYAAREAALMAYRDEIACMAGATCWLDGGDASRGMPLAQTIGAPEPSRHLYVCGPRGLIDAVLRQAQASGWVAGQLHSELFAVSHDGAAATAFEVELKASKLTLSVPPDKTILDVMIDAGLDPLFDCRRGDCGVCTAQIVDGEPEHRDICLSAADRARGDFCPCVSRAKSARLVLDL
ncbi:PDR/VanB family oxidoreductase [Paraburkholderia nemoris]|uniref:Carnitine monooxygenase reductase subunit n=1 Tax=Paraburkholderia nemoris TaxID=2793076 RepID=A0ABM8QYT9_9BURK|nr:MULTISPECIES: PDR/VanB family oxidoreductase [Paraburkholderia]MBK3810097.1 oxidoreductase [Paraburkholderia aspalathi]CAE6723697.1 Carnitine monooxygenase reductase subunit [Paraburkholderia nemoris]CAE6749381.1 Carnitine monooxygenase reductase subunit [Paraburkholderia nemoris]